MVWLIVVVGGGLGLTLCDQLHVHAGVLRYPTSDVRILGQAWWVPVEFLAAVVVILIGAAIVARRSPNRVTGPGVASAFVWFVASYAATATFSHHPRGLAVVIVVAWIARVAPRPDRWPLVGFSVALAVAGTLVEGTLAGAGAFEYLHPSIFHVPLWLPGLYLHGALLALDALRAVSRLSANAPAGAPLAVDRA